MPNGCLSMFHRPKQEYILRTFSLKRKRISSMAAIQWRTREERTESMDVDDLAASFTEATPPPASINSNKFFTLPPHHSRLSAGWSGDIVCEGTPKNNNSATQYATLPPARCKVESTTRHSFRNSVKRGSKRLLKNLKSGHLRMISNKDKINGIRAVDSLPLDYCASSCIIDTDNIDRGEVIFFLYSDDGLSYKKQMVPICNAGCPKHKIRWNVGCDEGEESHGEEYDSGGEFGDCDESQVEEVLANYSLKEAPIHVNTLGRLSPGHSFEAMSDDEFSSSFAYCETERLNTIRRSTRPRKGNAKSSPSSSSSSMSLNSASSRKSRFVANMNRKMTSKSWPLRSLWMFLTRQKDYMRRNKLEEMGETMESATRYIRIASHFHDTFIDVNVILQIVEGASQFLRDVQTDLIATALKAFFTVGDNLDDNVDDNVDVIWADDVPSEIQRHLAIGKARVHFSVPDIRQCVVCLLLSPDAAILMRRRQCVLLQSIAEVMECREECVMVVQTKPGRLQSEAKHRTLNGRCTLSAQHSTSSLFTPKLTSSPTSSSLPASPSLANNAVRSLEWMTYIPSFYS